MVLAFRSSVMEELEAVENYLLRGLYPASGLSKGEKTNLWWKAYKALYWLKPEDPDFFLSMAQRCRFCLSEKEITG